MFSSKPKLADGAMGSLLLSKGFSGCLEALVATHPQEIKAIHRTYADAGAEILLTHTFGANRLALFQKGYADSVEHFNQTAVRLLKEVIQERDDNTKPLIFGCIGPTQLSESDIQSLDFKILRATFREQATILAESGVEALVLETFYNAKELCMALEAISGLDLPVVSSVTLTAEGKFLDGTTWPELVAIWQHYNPDCVGMNCSDTPKKMFPVFESLKSQIDKPLWIKFNAGLPPHALSPKEFAKECEPYLSWGVDVLGGCCGTTPEHIWGLAPLIERK